MSIESVKLKYASRSAEAQFSSAQNAGMERVYTKIYGIRTSGEDVKEAEIWADTRLPQPQESHDVDANCRCFRSQLKQIEGTIWEGVYTYSNKRGDPNRQDPNPLARPAKRYYSSVTYDTHPQVDLDGTLIANTAGDRFADGVVVPKTYSVLRIVRNESYFSYDRAAEYQNTVNASVFMNRPAGTVKLASITGEEQFENEVWFVSVTYELQINTEKDKDGNIIGWDAYVVDAGPREYTSWKDSGNNTVYGHRFMLGSDGRADTKPHLLNGNGVFITPVTTAAQNAVYLRFKTFERKEFGPLLLE